jgi:hypothetical protein
MNRSYYSEIVSNFINEDSSSILGKLNAGYTNENLNIKQSRAWSAQIDLLKSSLSELANERVLFEFSIPRMGKRADNIIVLGDHILVIEFKIGSDSYDSSSINQVVDYALDLLNFHETSHDKFIVPILVATHAKTIPNSYKKARGLYSTILCNAHSLKSSISSIQKTNCPNVDTVLNWVYGNYTPTTSIIESARALYNVHSVEYISRF